MCLGMNQIHSILVGLGENFRSTMSGPKATTASGMRHRRHVSHQLTPAVARFPRQPLQFTLELMLSRDRGGVTAFPSRGGQRVGPIELSLSSMEKEENLWPCHMLD